MKQDDQVCCLAQGELLVGFDLYFHETIGIWWRNRKISQVRFDQILRQNENKKLLHVA